MAASSRTAVGVFSANRLAEQEGGLQHSLPGHSRNPAYHRRESQTSGRGDRFLRRAPHLGVEPVSEPSLTMPVIIIWLILKEQLRLISHTSPSENKLACAAELLDDAPNGLCVQIRATNFPWSTRGRLFSRRPASTSLSMER